MFLCTSMSPNINIYMLLCTSMSPNITIYILLCTSMSPYINIYMFCCIWAITATQPEINLTVQSHCGSQARDKLASSKPLRQQLVARHRTSIFTSFYAYPCHQTSIFTYFYAPPCHQTPIFKYFYAPPCHHTLIFMRLFAYEPLRQPSQR